MGGLSAGDSGGARWRVYTSQVPTSQLVWIYEMQEAQLREGGTTTLGFVAAIEILRSPGQQAVRLGSVDAKNPPYHFQLFLDADLMAVLACAGAIRSDH